MRNLLDAKIYLVNAGSVIIRSVNKLGIALIVANLLLLKKSNLFGLRQKRLPNLCHCPYCFCCYDTNYFILSYLVNMTTTLNK